MTAEAFPARPCSIPDLPAGIVKAQQICYADDEEVITLDYQRINVFLIGNATHDGEVKQAKESGKAYGDFRLAVRDRNGETVFFPVRCFGKLAESVKNVRKGERLFVDGELELSSFVGDDGAKRMAFKVVANTYRILGGKRGEPEKDALSEETAQT